MNWIAEHWRPLTALAGVLAFTCLWCSCIIGIYNASLPKEKSK